MYAIHQSLYASNSTSPDSKTTQHRLCFMSCGLWLMLCFMVVAITVRVFVVVGVSVVAVMIGYGCRSGGFVAMPGLVLRAMYVTGM